MSMLSNMPAVAERLKPLQGSEAGSFASIPGWDGEVVQVTAEEDGTLKALLLSFPRHSVPEDQKVWFPAKVLRTADGGLTALSSFLKKKNLPRPLLDGPDETGKGVVDRLDRLLREQLGPRMGCPADWRPHVRARTRLHERVVSISFDLPLRTAEKL